MPLVPWYRDKCPHGPVLYLSLSGFPRLAVKLFSSISFHLFTHSETNGKMQDSPVTYPPCHLDWDICPHTNYDIPRDENLTSDTTGHTTTWSCFLDKTGVKRFFSSCGVAANFPIDIPAHACCVTFALASLIFNSFKRETSKLTKITRANEINNFFKETNFLFVQCRLGRYIFQMWHIGGTSKKGEIFFVLTIERKVL